MSSGQLSPVMTTLEGPFDLGESYRLTARRMNTPPREVAVDLRDACVLLIRSVATFGQHVRVLAGLVQGCPRLFRRTARLRARRGPAPTARASDNTGHCTGRGVRRCTRTVCDVNHRIIESTNRVNFEFRLHKLYRFFFFFFFFFCFLESLFCWRF